MSDPKDNEKTPRDYESDTSSEVNRLVGRIRSKTTISSLRGRARKHAQRHYKKYKSLGSGYAKLYAYGDWVWEYCVDFITEEYDTPWLAWLWKKRELSSNKRIDAICVGVYRRLINDKIENNHELRNYICTGMD